LLELWLLSWKRNSGYQQQVILIVLAKTYSCRGLYSWQEGFCYEGKLS
jgi:hypothetical protein